MRELTEREQRGAETLPAAVLLVALSAIAPLSVDMFLPSLPTITDEFATSKATMQLGVTLFLVAFAGSQLIYGPASDRYGRRPLLFAGLALFVVGGLVALSAQSVGMLIAGRVLQGLGGGAGPALAQAIVLDVYGRDRAARIIAYMAIALPLAPAIAPIIGGFLHDAFGWHSVFVLLAVLGVGLLAAYRALLPETNGRETRAARPRSLAGDYRAVLSSRTFVAYALVMGLMFSGQLVFISSSSFVLIDELGLGARVYGFSFAAVALGIMAGATLSSRLVTRYPPERIVLGGALGATAAAALMAVLHWAGWVNVAAILVPMFGVAMGLGVTRPAALAGALVPFQHVAGLASALIGFTSLAIASLFNIAYGALVEVSSTSLTTGVFVALASGLAAVVILRPGTRDEVVSGASAVARGRGERE